jgi:hypothetical protein
LVVESQVVAGMQWSSEHTASDSHTTEHPPQCCESLSWQAPLQQKP